MIEAGAVEETNRSKIVGKRPAQLYRYALDSFDFIFPRSLNYLEIKRVKASKTMSFLTSAS